MLEQLQLAGEDVLPTSEALDSRLAQIRFMSTEADFKVGELKDRLKEIKEEALEPVKDQIELKKASIELWTCVAQHYEISAALEEARIKSELEELPFLVYAYSIAGDKNGVRIKVGTDQDMLDVRMEIHALYEMLIIAEFKDGVNQERGGYSVN